MAAMGVLGIGCRFFYPNGLSVALCDSSFPAGMHVRGKGITVWAESTYSFLGWNDLQLDSCHGGSANKGARIRLSDHGSHVGRRLRVGSHLRDYTSALPTATKLLSVRSLYLVVSAGTGILQRTVLLPHH